MIPHLAWFLLYSPVHSFLSHCSGIKRALRFTGGSPANGSICLGQASGLFRAQNACYPSRFALQKVSRCPVPTANPAFPSSWALDPLCGWEGPLPSACTGAQLPPICGRGAPPAAGTTPSKMLLGQAGGSYLQSFNLTSPPEFFSAAQLEARAQILPSSAVTDDQGAPGGEAPGITTVCLGKGIHWRESSSVSIFQM